MRRFLVLLRKELKELLTPQILVPFAVTIVMFMAIGNLIGAQGEQAQAKRRLALLDRDRTPYARVLADAARAAGFTVEEVEGDDPSDVVRDLRETDTSILLVVPEGFGEALAQGEKARIETYVVLSGFSLMGTRASGELAAVIAQANDALSYQAIAARAPGADVDALRTPIDVVPNVVIGQRRATVPPEAVMAFVSQQTTFVPIILFVVIVFAAQMVATALATEKENKTLESLLAMPVSRTGIVAAKMLAAGTIALLSAAAYMVGLNQYMRGMMKGFGGDEATRVLGTSGKVAEQLGLTLSASDYVLLGLTVFAAILVALAIALILGAFADSVKAVQALITPLMILVMVPYFLTMFLDISSLSPGLRTAVLAIPFAHPFMAAPNLFLGDTRAVLLGIVYQLAWFAALTVVAARVFSSDRLLTMRLSLSRRSR